MKGALLFSVALLALVTACQPEVSGPPFEPGHSLRSDSSVAVSVSVDETRLIGELRSVYPRAQGELIAAALSDPFMVGIKTPQNARGQAILDKIDAIRNARFVSMAKIQSSKAPTVFPATVVLVEQWSDTTATAVVWRRTRVIPHDVIALRADRATIGALGAGVRVLMKLRKEQGDSATVDEHVAVHGEHMPKQWKGARLALATSELDQLRQSKSAAIPSFGSVRSRTIYLTPTKEARPK